MPQRRQCMYCKTMLPSEGGPSDPISHGICEDCEVVVNAELDLADAKILYAKYPSVENKSLVQEAGERLQLLRSRRHMAAFASPKNRKAAFSLKGSIVQILQFLEQGLSILADKDILTQLRQARRLISQTTSRLNHLGLTAINASLFEGWADPPRIGDPYLVSVYIRSGSGHHASGPVYALLLSSGKIAWKSTWGGRNSSLDQVAAFLEHSIEKAGKAGKKPTEEACLDALAKQGAPGEGIGVIYFFNAARVDLIPYFDSDTGPTLQISRLFVLPKMRKAHIASKVMRLITAIADEYGCALSLTAEPILGHPNIDIFPFAEEEELNVIGFRSVSALKKFYGSFGFKPEDYSGLVRRPSKKR